MPLRALRFGERSLLRPSKFSRKGAENAKRIHTGVFLGVLRALARKRFLELLQFVDPQETLEEVTGAHVASVVLMAE